MRHSRIRQTIFPILSALIWGTAFVAQSMGANYVDAFTFVTARSVVAALVLGAGLWGYRLLCPGRSVRTGEEKRQHRRNLLLGGLSCGSALAIASILQQVGIKMTTAGKASFITALYIVLVPLCELFLKKKVPVTVWISVMVAAVGLYLLSVKEDFSVNAGDVYVALCAVCFTAHILIIDYFTKKVDGVELSCAQFVVTAAWGAVGMLMFEQPTFAAMMESLLPILYVGVFSSGVAYTLQILAQKDANPAVLSLLLSLESVFGAVSGALILHERMTGREYLGCGLMLAAVVASQLDFSAFTKQKSRQE